MNPARLRIPTGVTLLLVTLLVHPVTTRAASGDLDQSFGSGGMVSTDFGGGDDGRAVAIQADGKIVVAGATTVSTGYSLLLARYEPDGSLDGGFGTGGKVTSDIGAIYYPNALALQADGNIVVGAQVTTSTGVLARFDSTGTLDSGFGSGGVVQLTYQAGAVALKADGRIVAAGWRDSGSTFEMVLARYNADGSIDETFGTNGMATFSPAGGYVWDVAIQDDDRIVVAGTTANTAKSAIAVLVRFDPDGQQDGGFGTAGVTEDLFSSSDRGSAAASLFVQPDGKLVMAGTFSRPFFGSPPKLLVARYAGSGQPDPEFGLRGSGVARGKKNGRAVFVGELNDGRVVCMGGGALLVRYTSTGAFDQTFGRVGRFYHMLREYAAALQDDGNIVGVGSTGAFGYPPVDVLVTRFLP